MAEKRKYEGENPFAYELLPSEEILWIDQPDATRWFTTVDLFYVPFSLLWGGFMVFWNTSIWRSNAPSFFGLWGLAFLIIGFYVIFGRFLYKYWRKKRTYYAVTNKRLLIMTSTWGHHVSAFYLNMLPNLNKSVGRQGVGSITFGSPPSPSIWRRQGMNMSNTGLEFFGYQLPGFYDIHEVNDVYLLINELRDQQIPSEQGYDSRWEHGGKAKRR